MCERIVLYQVLDGVFQATPGRGSEKLKEFSPSRAASPQVRPRRKLGPTDAHKNWQAFFTGPTTFECGDSDRPS